MKKGFLHLLATLLMLASTAGLLVACSDSDDHSVTPHPSALPAVARLDTERGVVVTTASKEYAVPEFMSYLFGPASYHGNDIGLFYMNIRQNVEQRIAAWFARPNRASAADRNEH